MALTAASARHQRSLAAVRAWWRVTHPAPSLAQRLDVLYTAAIVIAIFGALAYGTASSALAQVVTAHRLAVFGPSLAMIAVLVAAQWGAYQGPVVFSLADVAHLLGAPLPRRGLAVETARGRARRWRGGGSGGIGGADRRSRRPRARCRGRSGGRLDRRSGRAGGAGRGGNLGGAALGTVRADRQASELAGGARGGSARARLRRGPGRSQDRLMVGPVGLGRAVRRERPTSRAARRTAHPDARDGSGRGSGHSRQRRLSHRTPSAPRRRPCERDRVADQPRRAHGPASNRSRRGTTHAKPGRPEPAARCDRVARSASVDENARDRLARRGRDRARAGTRRRGGGTRERGDGALPAQRQTPCRGGGGDDPRVPRSFAHAVAPALRARHAQPRTGPAAPAPRPRPARPHSDPA